MDKKRGQAGAVGAVAAAVHLLQNQNRKPGLRAKAHCPGLHVSRNNWNSIWGSALGHMPEETQKFQKDQTNPRDISEYPKSEQQADGYPKSEQQADGRLEE